jgi:hypothetical protein
MKTTIDEALDKALEALTALLDEWTPARQAQLKGMEAVAAIKQARSAQVQEPTATVTSESGNPDVTMSWWHEPALPVGTKLYATPPAAQQTCNCRWDGEVQVQQCTLHEAHVDAIHEWAERAKAAEAKLKAQPAPVQEPVAWCSQCGHKCPQTVNQEPVGWWDAKLGFFEEKHFDQLHPVYTTPPAAQRQWVGLSDQEIRDTYEWCSGQSEMDRCRAIEAKLRSKNEY